MITIKKIIVFVLATVISATAHLADAQKPGKVYRLGCLSGVSRSVGGRMVRHARHIPFQLAEVAVSRDVFAALLERIRRLCPAPG